MNRKFLLLLISIIVYKAGNSQQSYSDSVIQKKIVLLKNLDGNHGSGTIIKYKDRFFLLSAHHVISVLTNESEMLFRNAAGQVDSLKLKAVFPDPTKQSSHIEGDVEVLLLSPRNQNDIKLFELLSFDVNVVYKELTDIPRELNVIVYGFPLYSLKNFEAMSYYSYLSSGLMDLPRADNKKTSWFYLLENPAMQGFSGGPVFISMSKQGMTPGPSQTFLIGVVHGTQYDNTGGKFAMITPSWYIANLLDSLKIDN